MDLLTTIKEKSKSNPKRIIYPETEDDRILRAAEIVLKEGTAQIILIGDPNKIKQKESELKLNLSGATIINPLDQENASKLEQFSAQYFELRKHKGVTIEQAREIVKDPVFFGTMLIYNNEADGMVTGACHTTAETLRPALQIIKTKEGIKYASSYFIMVQQEKVYFFADCAFIEFPDAEQLSEIALMTAESAKSFGFEPRVAMLSFSTKGSASNPGLDKVKIATELVKRKAPNLIVDGELQLDAAIVPEVAKKKCSNSAIQGDANVLIFPDLNAGNIGYKLVERFGKAHAIGPIVQGLKKPINDLSRGCIVEDIVLTTMITVIEAQR